MYAQVLIISVVGIIEKLVVKHSVRDEDASSPAARAAATKTVRRQRRIQ